MTTLPSVSVPNCPATATNAPRLQPADQGRPHHQEIVSGTTVVCSPSPVWAIARATTRSAPAAIWGRQLFGTGREEIVDLSNVGVEGGQLDDVREGRVLSGEDLS